MGLFDNIKGLKDSISKTATVNSEQAKLSKINKEISTINSEIDSACTQIGKRFLEYVLETNEMPEIDVSDILKMLDPKMSRKVELEKEVIEIQKRLKDSMILQEKRKVEEDFILEKEKLDKALAMDLISQDEYNEKINNYRKRLDNFEEIKKIEQQYDFGIITLEEKNQKINLIIKS